MRYLERVSGPASEPLNDGDAAKWVAASIEDGEWFATNVPLIRDEYERHMGRSMLTVTWRLTLDLADLYYPDGSTRECLILPMWPVLAVSSITYYDDDDTSATWSASEYRVTTGDMGRIAPRTGYTWPAPAAGLREYACLVVEFTAGYDAADITKIPGPLMVGLRELVTFWHTHRGEGFIVGRSMGPEAGAEVRSTPRAVERVYQRLASWQNAFTL